MKAIPLTITDTLAVVRIQSVGEQQNMAGQRSTAEIAAMNRLYYGDNLDILRNRIDSELPPVRISSR